MGPVQSVSEDPIIHYSYIQLPDGLRNSIIKNNDNKCSLWCDIRHLNLVKRHPERISKVDKKRINDLDYEGINFSVSKLDFFKIERQNNICVNVFCYENGLNYLVYLSDQKFHNSMDLLLIDDKNKSRF